MNLKYIRSLRIGTPCTGRRKYYTDMINKYCNKIYLTDEQRENYETIFRIDESVGFTDSFFDKQGGLYSNSEIDDFTIEQIKAFRKALDSLTDKQRVIIDLLLDGCNSVEICDKLNITNSYIDQTLYGSISGKRHKGGIILKLRKLIGVE